MCHCIISIIFIYFSSFPKQVAIDVLPSKNQALCEYCAHDKTADYLISLSQVSYIHVKRNSSLRNPYSNPHTF